MKLKIYPLIWIATVATMPLGAVIMILPNRVQSTSTPVETYTVPTPTPAVQNRQVTIPGFLLSTEIEPLCILTQGFEEETIIANNIIFACSRKKELQVDKIYSVIRKESDFEDKTDSSHTLYWMVSQVRILSTDMVSTGKVETEIIPIEPGDWVVEQKNVTRTFQMHPPTSLTGSHQAAIVAFSISGQTYAVEDDFVFLNQGRKAGIDVDAVLLIQSPPSESNSDPLPNQPSIGTLQIIEATETSAIGYLVKTTKEIPLGAFVLF